MESRSTPANSASPAPPTREFLARAPKVLLHEHLDGGLRPRTVLELAAACGYGELPQRDEERLADWFAAGAARGSLPLYLEGFRHTIALMQTSEALERVAYEFVEDMRLDGVVYAEVRFAPHFHTQQGLGLDGVMAAVCRGLERGRADFGVQVGLIVCAMRNMSSMLSYQMAELAVAWRSRGPPSGS
jgi:adenosine deaminase